jgi:hypothetical protein
MTHREERRKGIAAPPPLEEVCLALSARWRGEKEGTHRAFAMGEFGGGAGSAFFLANNGYIAPETAQNSGLGSMAKARHAMPAYIDRS